MFRGKSTPCSLSVNSITRENIHNVISILFFPILMETEFSIKDNSGILVRTPLITHSLQQVDSFVRCLACCTVSFFFFKWQRLVFLFLRNILQILRRIARILPDCHRHIWIWNAGTLFKSVLPKIE